MKDDGIFALCQSQHHVEPMAATRIGSLRHPIQRDTMWPDVAYCDRCTSVAEAFSLYASVPVVAATGSEDRT